MFSKRRKNYITFVNAALIVTLCVLIVVIFWPDGADVATKDGAETTNSEQKVNVNIDTQEKEEVTDNSTETTSESYYIVKKDGDYISVYFVNEKGVSMKLEETEILYDLLPIEDQKNFEKGIVIKGQEGLASLLQDYEG